MVENRRQPGDPWDSGSLIFKKSGENRAGFHGNGFGIQSKILLKTLKTNNLKFYLTRPEFKLTI
jgi:hypothetical protein